MVNKVYTHRHWLICICLLLDSSTISFAIANRNDLDYTVYEKEADEFQSILVTSSGDVIVHLQETLLQFQCNNITESGIKHQVNISRERMWDPLEHIYHNEPTVFQSYSTHQNKMYLLVCHVLGCSAYDVMNINISHEVLPEYIESADAILNSKTSAQVVIYDKDSFFSALTDLAGTSTLTLSYFEHDSSPILYKEKSFDSNQNQSFEFVYSFKTGQYVYFIRNVKEAYRGGNKAMISQMCGSDQFLRSYLESNLGCKNHSRVLSGTIIDNKYVALVMGNNTGSTDLCVFDIERIEHHFKQTLTNCFENAVGSWPEWVNETGESCAQPSTRRTYECGHTNQNTKIYSGQYLYTNNYTVFDIRVADRSMLFQNYNGTVYGYIGTKLGIIRKVIFNEPSRDIAWLSEINASASPIRQMVFNNDSTSILFISANALGKIEVDPTCPPNHILIEPMQGPVNGGTILTINGLFKPQYANQNIRSDISVTMGNVPCQIIQEYAKYSNRVTCNTPEVRSAGNVTITVETRITYPFRCSGSYEYGTLFVYMDPTMDNSSTIENQRISVKGCVPISVRGNNLDIGTTRTMNVGNRVCNIIDSNRTMITCQAPEQDSPSVYQVTLRLDNANLTGPLVTYIPEPNVTDIEPRYAMLSGGIVVTITGENLDGLGPDLRLFIQSVKSEICKTYGNWTSFTIECETPKITTFPTQPVNIKGDHCDHVSTVIPLSIVPDPVMEVEDQLITDEPEHSHVPVFFEGANLTHIQSIDVTILVGTEKCLEIEVQKDVISCKLPRESLPKQMLKEKVSCNIGFRRYDLGTIALVEVPNSGNNRTNSGDDTNYSGIIIGTLFGLVCVSCVAGFIIRRRRKKRRMESLSVHYTNNAGVLSLEGLSESHVSETLLGRPNDYMSSRFLRADNTNVKEPTAWTPLIAQDVLDMLDNAHLLIQKDNLVLGEIIGQGHFGCVYKGYLQLNTEKTERIVACKTLHRTNPEELDVESFLKEALVMKDFHHKNVMELLGICLGIKTLPLVILPFMRLGDVLSYIRSVSNIPTVKQLVVFGVDVANGMDYLSQLKFVHRDLAARNCMIADDMTVKVADFGLSRDVYEKEYYTSCDKKAKLPVKWMSPESLEFGIYTTKSDVWSFGVLMWELLTRGVNPYPTVDGWDILRYLTTGRRLNKPEFCPDEMFRILESCWEWEPNNRPTFGDLTTSIPELLRRLERASERRKLVSTRSVDKDETENVGISGRIEMGQAVENVHNVSDTDKRSDIAKEEADDVGAVSIHEDGGDTRREDEGVIETDKLMSPEKTARGHEPHTYINKDSVKVD